LHCAKIADHKKGDAIVVLDIQKISTIADYFVFISGTSDKHVKALAEEIDLRVHKDLGANPYHIEGRRDSKWIIVDYVDVVVHIFTREAREFYNLETLWGDAKKVDWT
jgi:ribosome-associated protein